MSAVASEIAVAGRRSGRSSGVAPRYRVERRKLATQLAPRLLALVCLLGPFAFVGMLKVQSGSPTDSLYGVWVHSSGFALSLVVLGFSGQWGLPLMAGVLAGDLFGSEDRYGTWKPALTRSCTRWHMFAGKVLAVALFAIGLLASWPSRACPPACWWSAHLARQPERHPVLDRSLPGAGRGLLLIFLAPMLAFVSLAVLFSIATRNGIVGVLGPAVRRPGHAAAALVGTGVWLHTLLVASAFDGWHALFVSDPFYGPLVIGEAVSVVWIAVCLTASWRLLRRRDFAGARSRDVRVGSCRCAWPWERRRWSPSSRSPATGDRSASPPRG